MMRDNVLMNPKIVEIPNEDSFKNINKNVNFPPHFQMKNKSLLSFFPKKSLRVSMSYELKQINGKEQPKEIKGGEN